MYCRGTKDEHQAYNRSAPDALHRTENTIHNTQSLHNNYKCTQARDRCKEVSAEPEANDCQCMRLRELISLILLSQSGKILGVIEDHPQFHILLSILVYY